MTATWIRGNCQLTQRFSQLELHSRQQTSLQLDPMLDHLVALAVGAPVVNRNLSKNSRVFGNAHVSLARSWLWAPPLMNLFF